MRVYLAGPISGHADYREKFAAAAERLRAKDHSVYNPAAANLEGMPLARIMSHVLVQLCEAEAIALQPGWSMSPGACIERDLAKYLGLKIIPLEGLE